MAGYEVDTEELNAAAGRIDAIVDQADALDLETVPEGADVGHHELKAALQKFCRTWDLAQQRLQEDAHGLATDLHNAAGSYD